MEHRLTDGSILLRPYRAEDAEPMYAAIIESREQLIPWLPWCHDAYAIEETRGWIASREQALREQHEQSFLIVDAADGTILGGCGLNLVDLLNRRANLGYWVRRSAEGRGIATAATKLVAAFGLGELGLIRIEILAAVDNVASRRVAIKAGAEPEGVLRRRLLLHGVPHDAVMHSIVAMND